MRNRNVVLILFLTMFVLMSCEKEFVSKPITIEATSNVEIDNFRFHNSCGPSPYYLNYWGEITNQGNGIYRREISEEYDEVCFVVSGDIPANTDTTGKTIISVRAFYSDEGNVCGFYDLEIDRPHNANTYALNFEFRADTYIE